MGLHDQKEEETGFVEEEFRVLPSHTHGSDPKEIHLFLEVLVPVPCSHQMHHLPCIKVPLTTLARKKESKKKKIPFTKYK